VTNVNINMKNEYKHTNKVTEGGEGKGRED
jgi:hypothetical protein